MGAKGPVPLVGSRCVEGLAAQSCDALSWLLFWSVVHADVARSSPSRITRGTRGGRGPRRRDTRCRCALPYPPANPHRDRAFRSRGGAGAGAGGCRCWGALRRPRGHAPAVRWREDGSPGPAAAPWCVPSAPRSPGGDLHRENRM